MCVLCCGDRVCGEEKEAFDKHAQKIGESVFYSRFEIEGLEC